MCKSLAEGGQRCYSHTSKALTAAENAVTVAQQRLTSAEQAGSAYRFSDPRHTDAHYEIRAAEEAVEKARWAHTQAQWQHASTRGGRAEYEQAIRDIEASTNRPGVSRAEFMAGEHEIGRLRNALRQGEMIAARNKELEARFKSDNPNRPAVHTITQAEARTQLAAGTRVEVTYLRRIGEPEQRTISVSNGYRLETVRPDGTPSRLEWKGNTYQQDAEGAIYVSDKGGGFVKYRPLDN